MKAKSCVIMLGIGCCLKNVCFGEEKDYQCRGQLPPDNVISFCCQMEVLEHMFTWNSGSPHAALNSFGNSVLGELNAKVELLKQQNGSSVRVPSDHELSSLVIKELARKLQQCPQDANTEMTQEHLVYLDFTLPKFPFITPIPEGYLPVGETFANKSPVQIFGECMRTPFMSASRAPYFCEEQKRKGESCDITELDCSIVERVLRQPQSSGKTILFVGFDQTSPEEGGDIYAHTPGYERSLFLSAWEDRPSEGHNQIKPCFCQMPRLLEMCPAMRNAFDYIIVGGQTREYVYPEAWVTFGHMLKPGGRLVYASYEGAEFTIFGIWLNQILRGSVAEEGFSFVLYECNDASESIYQEIQQLAGFNTEATWCRDDGFFYTKAGAAFCWHKKTVPSRE
jgi:hypothetical protein